MFALVVLALLKSFYCFGLLITVANLVKYVVAASDISIISFLVFVAQFPHISASRGNLQHLHNVEPTV